MRTIVRFVLTLAVTLVLATAGVPAAAAQTAAPPTPTETAYLLATQPFRDRLGRYQEQLAAHQQAAAEGQLDSIALAELGDLTRELFAARQAFTNAVPSTRLDLYDRTMKLGLARAYEATALLVRAQVTDSVPDREALIRAAGEQGQSSQRLLKDATDELQSVGLATSGAGAAGGPESP
jgi:hypothetical protein